MVALLQTCMKLERLSLSGSSNFPEIVAEATAPVSLVSFSSNDEQSVLSGPFIGAITIMAQTLVSMILHYSYSTIGDDDIHFLVQTATTFLMFIGIIIQVSPTQHWFVWHGIYLG